MNREKMIEAARHFLDCRDYEEVYTHGVYKPPAGFDAQMLLDHFTDFAIEQVKEERKRIAAELIQLHKSSPADFLRELSYYVQELAGQDSMAHRLLDELREQNEHRKDN